MKFLFHFLVLFKLTCFFTQESKSVSTGIRFNRIDFFQENTFSIHQKNVKHNFGFGFGINKTIFQQRFSPAFFYCISSNFNQISKVEFQLLASYHLNFFNVNKKNSEIHFFNELLSGFNVSYGKKNKLFLCPQLGLISENFKSEYFNNKQIHINYSYSLKIGYSHGL